MSVSNPVTGKLIKLNGPTYKDLLKDGYIYDKCNNMLFQGQALKNQGNVKPILTIKPKLNINVNVKTKCEIGGFTQLIADDLIPKKLVVPDDYNPKYIVHLADIHIPIHLHEKKYDEYRSVFNNLYVQLRKLPLKETLIVIAGDLLDTKPPRTENETIVLAQNFLSVLSLMTHTVVTLGNHDFTENNLTRLDSITAICNLLPQVHVLKYTGIYEINGLSLVFNSLFDTKFIHRADVHTVNKVCMLYHGSIVGAYQDNGQVINESRVKKYPSMEDFQDYDIVALGHIHLRQYLKSNIAYSGSLVQHKFNEHPTDHGYILWNLETNEGVSYDVYNPYAQIIITINGGVVLELDKLRLFELKDRKLRIRCDLKETSLAEFAIIEQYLNENYKIEEIISKNINTHGTTNKKQDDDKEITLDEELKIIRTMCKPELYDKVGDLHRKFYKSVSKSGECKRWRPLQMKFKNLFIYGNDYVNTVNFTDGVIDICSPNMTGKSSLVNIMIFALFDGISITNKKKTDVLNKLSTAGYVYLTFSCNGQTYCINKTITTKVRGAEQIPSYSVEFNRIDKLGMTLLNGSTETDTIKIIQNYVGTRNQFLNNNIVCTRSNASSLLSMTPTDLMKHMNSVCKLDQYENYVVYSKKEHKLVSINLANLQTLQKDADNHMQQYDVNHLNHELESIIVKCDEIKTTIETTRIDRDNKLACKAAIQGNIIHLDNKLGVSKHPILSIDSIMLLINQKTCDMQKYSDLERHEATKYTKSLIHDRIIELQKLINPLHKTIEVVDAELKVCKKELLLHDNFKPTNLMSEKQIVENMGSSKQRMQVLINNVTGIECDLVNLKNKIKIGLDSVCVNDDIDMEILKLQKDKICAEVECKSYKISDLQWLQKEICKLLPLDTYVSAFDRRVELIKQKTLMEQKISSVLKPVLKPLNLVTIDKLREQKRDEEVVLVKHQLPVNYNNMLIEYDKKLLEYKEQELPAIQIKIMDNVRWVLYDDHIKYSKQDYYKGLKKDLDELTAKIAYNVDIDKIIVKNSSINANNLKIESQIRWLEQNEYVIQLEQLNKQIVDLDVYLQIFANVKIVEELQHIQQLQLELSCLEQYKYLQEYNDLKKEFTLSSAMLLNETNLLKTYEGYLKWYEKLNLLEQRVDILLREQQQIVKNSEFYSEIEYLRLLNQIILHADELKEGQNNLESYKITESLHKLHIELGNIIGEILEMDNILAIHVKIQLDLNNKVLEIRNILKQCELAQEHKIKRHSEICMLDMENTVYNEYERIISRTGLPAVLLKNKLCVLTDAVNKIFQKYTKYMFECTLELKKGDDQKIQLLIKNVEDDTEMDPARLSGFESVLLNISMCEGIMEVDKSFKSEIFVVDESLDCVDADRFVNCLPLIFNVLKACFKTIIFISHRDVPQCIVENKIRIIHKGSYSMID